MHHVMKAHGRGLALLAGWVGGTRGIGLNIVPIQAPPRSPADVAAHADRWDVKKGIWTVVPRGAAHGRYPKRCRASPTNPRAGPQGRDRPPTRLGVNYYTRTSPRRPGRPWPPSRCARRDLPHQMGWGNLLPGGLGELSFTGSRAITCRTALYALAENAWLADEVDGASGRDPSARAFVPPIGGGPCAIAGGADGRGFYWSLLDNYDGPWL